MVSDRKAKTFLTHVALAVVVRVQDGLLQVLLWQRARAPFKGAWSLPGGTLAPGETLEQSIRRHLASKVDVRELSHLEQLETLSAPDRNPPNWELATAYLGLIPTDADPTLPLDTRWHPIETLPRLASDHKPIILTAARAPPRQALLHQPRLRPRPRRVHDLGTTRHLHRRTRTRSLPNQPAAHPPPQTGTEANGKATSPKPDRRTPSSPLQLRPTHTRGNRPIRGTPPTRKLTQRGVLVVT